MPFTAISVYGLFLLHPSISCPLCTDHNIHVYVHRTVCDTWWLTLSSEAQTTQHHIWHHVCLNYNASPLSFIKMVHHDLDTKWKCLHNKPQKGGYSHALFWTRFSSWCKHVDKHNMFVILCMSFSICMHLSVKAMLECSSENPAPSDISFCMQNGATLDWLG